jgi:phosphatidylserine decarboxylase
MLGRRLGMQLEEAELPLEQYRSFADLFTRRLRPGARDLCPTDEDAFLCPADGAISACGQAFGDAALQAKAMSYSLRELLGDVALAERLRGGTYLTVYLRPRDYHRVHAPLAGKLIACRRWPGTVLPVQPSSVRNVVGLYVRNERVVLHFETDLGAMAVVLVGATAVRAITTPFEDGTRGFCGFDPPLNVSRGDEVGTFNLGSTVIVVVERGQLELAACEVGDEVRVGQILAKRAAGF